MGGTNYSSRSRPPVQLARCLRVQSYWRLPLRLAALLPLGMTRDNTQARPIVADIQVRPAEWILTTLVVSALRPCLAFRRTGAGLPQFHRLVDHITALSRATAGPPALAIIRLPS